LEAETLRFVRLERWPSYAPFEAALSERGPWIAGFDFPFGFSRRFIEGMGWPRSWPECICHVGSLSRDGFRHALTDYKRDRPAGDKEHRRRTDAKAGSVSAQKLNRPPVALMLYEGAPRLLAAGVTIPGLSAGDPERIALEAYPGVLARRLIGRTTYKQDTRSKQTQEQREARLALMRAVAAESFRGVFGFRVEAPAWLADDPAGDDIDAMLCATQAAWAWTRRLSGYGAPTELDPLEGWIADPALA
jgi:hypothetical protein